VFVKDVDLEVMLRPYFSMMTMMMMMMMMMIDELINF